MEVMTICMNVLPEGIEDPCNFVVYNVYVEG